MVDHMQGEHLNPCSITPVPGWILIVGRKAGGGCSSGDRISTRTDCCVCPGVTGHRDLKVQTGKQLRLTQANAPSRGRQVGVWTPQDCPPPALQTWTRNLCSAHLTPPSLTPVLLLILAPRRQAGGCSTDFRTQPTNGAWYRNSSCLHFLLQNKSEIVFGKGETLRMETTWHPPNISIPCTGSFL